MEHHEGLSIMQEFLKRSDKKDLSGMRQLLADDIRVVEAESLPFGGEYNGWEDFLDLSRSLFGGLRHGKVTLKSTWPSQDSSLTALFELSGKSKRTGEDFTMPLVEIWTFRNGKISSITPFYFDTHTLRQFF